MSVNYPKWLAQFKKEHPEIKNNKEVKKAWNEFKQKQTEPVAQVEQQASDVKFESPKIDMASSESEIMTTPEQKPLSFGAGIDGGYPTTSSKPIPQQSVPAESDADKIMQRLEGKYPVFEGHKKLASVGVNFMDEGLTSLGYAMKHKGTIHDGMSMTIAKYDHNGWLAEYAPEITLVFGLGSEGFSVARHISKVKQEEKVKKEMEKLEQQKPAGQ